MSKIIRLIGFLALLLMGSALAKTTTISVWAGYPELAPFYQHVADQFKADHPNIQIKILTMPLRDYEQRLLVSLPSNTAGCILEINAQTAGRLIQGGFLPPLPEDLQEFVRSGVFGSGALGKLLVSHASYKGKVYGVPLFRGEEALFYNTQMFKEAGLSGPPQTMDEYIDFAKKLTVRDGSGKITRSGWSLRLSGGGSGIAEKFSIIMHQFGGSIVKQNPDGTWVANYDNEAGRKALQLYVDLVNKYNVDAPYVKADSQGFELGATAMFQRESWVVGDIAKKAPDLPYATAPLPNTTIISPVNLYVTCDNPAAYDFVRDALKPENQLWLLKNVGWLPNRQDVDYSPVIKEIPQFGAFMNLPKDMKFFTIPPIKPIDEIETRLAERLVKGYVNKDLVDNPAGIAKFLHDAATETNSILKRASLQ